MENSEMYIDGSERRIKDVLRSCSISPDHKVRNWLNSNTRFRSAEELSESDQSAEECVSRADNRSYCDVPSSIFESASRAGRQDSIKEWIRYTENSWKRPQEGKDEHSWKRPQQGKESSDSSTDISSVPTYSTRRLYTKEEHKAIIQYIVENDAYPFIKGKILWQKMELEKVCDRSWQSMKEQFRSKIYKNLNNFDLPSKEKEKFIKSMESTARAKSCVAPHPGNRGWRRNANFYSSDEDRKLLKYLLEKKRYRFTRRTLLWKQMETRNILPGRTWQSLQSRFKNFIIPHLESFNLNKEEIEKLNFTPEKDSRKRKNESSGSAASKKHNSISSTSIHTTVDKDDHRKFRRACLFAAMDMARFLMPKKPVRKKVAKNSNMQQTRGCERAGKDNNNMNTSSTICSLSTSTMNTSVEGEEFISSSDSHNVSMERAQREQIVPTTSFCANPLPESRSKSRDQSNETLPSLAQSAVCHDAKEKHQSQSVSQQSGSPMETNNMENESSLVGDSVDAPHVENPEDEKHMENDVNQLCGMECDENIVTIGPEVQTSTDFLKRRDSFENTETITSKSLCDKTKGENNSEPERKVAETEMVNKDSCGMVSAHEFISDLSGQNTPLKSSADCVGGDGELINDAMIAAGKEIDCGSSVNEKNAKDFHLSVDDCEKSKSNRDVNKDASKQQEVVESPSGVEREYLTCDGDDVRNLDREIDPKHGPSQVDKLSSVYKHSAVSSKESSCTQEEVFLTAPQTQSDVSNCECPGNVEGENKTGL